MWGTQVVNVNVISVKELPVMDNSHMKRNSTVIFRMYYSIRDLRNYLVYYRKGPCPLALVKCPNILSSNSYPTFCWLNSKFRGMSRLLQVNNNEYKR